ncbi:9418_t:CDS:2 [Acaulospora colombiana]|uniref:9418_t:CDS:1 n=1 Tax=Acaulospora colombiana TaxID=27376 RepID=A0ACA9MXZ0_9GLOM|nr:9418_t:CDS:2 [Acaulospora colombiana]
MEATDEEKRWWFEGIRPCINNERNVPFKEFAEKSEKAKAKRFWDHDKGTVMIIELPYGDHEGAICEFISRFRNHFNNMASQDDIRCWGAKSLYDLATGEYKEPDACFVPRRLLNLPNPVLNPCDNGGNPWPTIILEVASFEILDHVKNKVNNFWLIPNRCEDVLPQTSDPGVAIDLYDIQQAVFDAMDKN